MEREKKKCVEGALDDSKALVFTYADKIRDYMPKLVQRAVEGGESSADETESEEEDEEETYFGGIQSESLLVNAGLVRGAGDWATAESAAETLEIVKGATTQLFDSVRGSMQSHADDMQKFYRARESRLKTRYEGKLDRKDRKIQDLRSQIAKVSICLLRVP